MMSQLVLSSPWVLAGRYFLLSIRGTRGLVARLDATLGAIRGIGEGVAVQRERGFCAVCAVCAASVQPTNGLIKPFIRLAAQTAQCFYKKIFI